MLAFLVWRAALIIADGANLDVNYPALLGLSFEDIVTGVMTFLFAALAGAAAILVDRFV